MERRGTRAAEYLGAMRALWEHERPSFDGAFVSFSGVSAHPRPLQRPLPVVMGGYSPAVHRRAARECPRVVRVLPRSRCCSGADREHSAGPRRCRSRRVRVRDQRVAARTARRRRRRRVRSVGGGSPRPDPAGRVPAIGRRAGGVARGSGGLRPGPRPGAARRHAARRVGVSAPGRIRTCDFRLRRAALYPLSYGR
jgi:alkanesulfonate monooxygenase SsuD/methylene tetrahydromethanopterin reductase-like flavin-dependent oxidoreductase (luciferase family)